MKLIDCCDNFGINYIVGFVTKSKVKEIKCQECRNFLCCPGTKSALIERKEFPECNLFCVNNDLQTFFKFTERKLKKPSLTIDSFLQNKFISNMVSLITFSSCNKYPIASLCKCYGQIYNTM